MMEIQTLTECELVDMTAAAAYACVAWMAAAMIGAMVVVLAACWWVCRRRKGRCTSDSGGR